MVNFIISFFKIFIKHLCKHNYRKSVLHMHNRLTETRPFYCIPSFDSLCTHGLKVGPRRVVKTLIFLNKGFSYFFHNGRPPFLGNYFQ